MYTQYFTERIKEELYSDRELCAIINNNNLLREHIESLPWLVGDDELTEEQTVDLNSMLNNVTAPLIELNTLAAHALGDLIIGDIDAARVSERVIWLDVLIIITIILHYYCTQLHLITLCHNQSPCIFPNHSLGTGGELLQ